MYYNKSIYFISFFLFLVTLSIVSCTKENIDIDDPGDPIVVDTLYCDIVTEIIEDLDSTGSLLRVEVEGGVMPFTYLWSDGSTDSLLPLLVDGAYEVTVTDALDCSSVSDYDNTIDFCDDFRLQIVPDRDSSGMITLFADVYGGLMPYQFLWGDGSDMDFLFIGDTPGIYELTVTDSMGCLLVDEYQQ